MMDIKCVTWNVNSIRARLNHVIKYLREEKPDFLLIQETKSTEEQFPFSEIEDEGYNIYHKLEKRYNGVAIITKHEAEEVKNHLDYNELIEHKDQYDVMTDSSRFIEGTFVINDKTWKIASIYAPNGGVNSKEAHLNLPVDKTERFFYKMAFYNDLISMVQRNLSEDINMIYSGDYNIMPEEIDVYNPKGWDGCIGFHPTEREKFRELLQTGLIDTFRFLHPEDQIFSWWDYRHQAFTRNMGVRIDFHLVNEKFKDNIKFCDTNLDFRGLEKPSDHAPVELIINI